MSLLPPLSLYVHVPWCVKKCPYCDFNSHTLKGELPESEYISHLLADLDVDLKAIDYAAYPRQIKSIFIGGGTPSLFTPEGINTLLRALKKRLQITPYAEITMEANPGTFEADRFTGFKNAGINRLSIGVQSYQIKHLKLLGRIHDDEQAKNAVIHAQSLHFTSFNTDIMHGLPAQTIDDALQDLQCSIDADVPHISWYQLTIEPNTQFFSKPPSLPNDDLLWEIQQKGHNMLTKAGYTQYEISAYAKDKHQSLHNLNYWRFGDYLGIGCGAHSKITIGKRKEIIRSRKIKHPKGYMDLRKEYVYHSEKVSNESLPFEFFMNRFRLVESCPKTAYADTTCGRELPKSALLSLQKSRDKGLLIETEKDWQVSVLGRRYLNDLLTEFV